MIESLATEMVHTQYPEDPLQQFLSYSGSDFDLEESINAVNVLLESVPLPDCQEEPFELFEIAKINESLIPTSPPHDLKPLPTELKYVPLDSDGSHNVIISSSLDETQEKRVIDVIQRHRSAIGWTLEDIKGIDPNVCSHRISLK